MSFKRAAGCRRKSTRDHVALAAPRHGPFRGFGPGEERGDKGQTPPASSRTTFLHLSMGKTNPFHLLQAPRLKSAHVLPAALPHLTASPSHPPPDSLRLVEMTAAPPQIGHISRAAMFDLHTHTHTRGQTHTTTRPADNAINQSRHKKKV